MGNLERTKHYTTESEQICSNLIKWIPADSLLIEPFVGEGDLLSLFPEGNWEKYDIEDKGNNIIQDTLLFPPDYKNKWVITNPPYLAKNKASDKKIFSKYNTDDLYKASLLTLLEAAGGIIIIPTNFFTDERSQEIRVKFMNTFDIKEINIFTRPVFATTTYSVCSFAFIRKEKVEPQKQKIKINIKPEEKEISVELDPLYGYRVAGKCFSELERADLAFGRLIGCDSADYITNIKLYAIDSREKRIRLEYDETPHCGKNTDRTLATLTCKVPLTKENELKLIECFNSELENFRQEYSDLPLTNYRDYNRKRIGFTFVYQLLTKIYEEVIL